MHSNNIHLIEHYIHCPKTPLFTGKEETENLNQVKIIQIVLQFQEILQTYSCKVDFEMQLNYIKFNLRIGYF